VESLEQLDLDRALAFYRERFADASGFRFAIVGNFTLESIRPLVETWIGGLPAEGRRDAWRDVGVEAPQGVVRFEVKKGIEPKGRVAIHFHGDAEWSPLEEHQVASLASVLRIRLREVLREDLGGVYGVGVSGSISHYPRQRRHVSISFGCDPLRAGELRAAALQEIESLKAAGPQETYVEKVREAQRRERETDLQRNAFWIGEIVSHEMDGLDPREILKYDGLVAAVTRNSLQEAARRYLDTTRYVEGVLLPEGAAEPAEGR
jgi:zinc protease